MDALHRFVNGVLIENVILVLLGNSAFFFVTDDLLCTVISDDWKLSVKYFCSRGQLLLCGTFSNKLHKQTTLLPLFEYCEFCNSAAWSFRA